MPIHKEEGCSVKTLMLFAAVATITSCQQADEPQPYVDTALIPVLDDYLRRTKASTDAGYFKMHALAEIGKVETSRPYRVIYLSYEWSTSDPPAPRGTNKLLLFWANKCVGDIYLHAALSVSKSHAAGTEISLVSTDVRRASVSLQGDGPPQIPSDSFVGCYFMLKPE